MPAPKDPEKYKIWLEKRKIRILRDKNGRFLNKSGVVTWLKTNIIERYKKGETIKEIAKSENCSDNYIRDRLKKASVWVKGKNRKPVTNEHIKHMCDAQRRFNQSGINKNFPLKICRWCKKSFRPKTGGQMYCGSQKEIGSCSWMALRKWHEKNRKNPKHRYIKTKNDAHKRGLIFSLSFAEFIKILNQPCIYCGSKEKIGIDRVNSLLGYTNKNCVSCCGGSIKRNPNDYRINCNLMKNGFTKDEFINHCIEIAEFQKQQLGTNLPQNSYIISESIKQSVNELQNYAM